MRIPFSKNVYKSIRIVANPYRFRMKNVESNVCLKHKEQDRSPLSLIYQQYTIKEIPLIGSLYSPYVAISNHGIVKNRKKD